MPVASSRYWVEGGGGEVLGEEGMFIWIVSLSQLSQTKSPDVRLRNIGFYLHSKMKDSSVRIIHHP